RQKVLCWVAMPAVCCACQPETNSMPLGFGSRGRDDAMLVAASCHAKRGVHAAHSRAACCVSPPAPESLACSPWQDAMEPLHADRHDRGGPGGGVPYDAGEWVDGAD